MLNEASSPKDKLGLIYRIMLNVKNGEEGAITPEEQAYVDKVLAELKEQGYEMDNDGLIGGDYNEGNNEIVDDIQFVKPGDPRYNKLEDGQTVINRIIKPRILKDGKLYQAATVGAIVRSDTSVSSELYEAKKKLARLLRADNNNEIIQHQIAEIKAEIAVLEKKKAEELASKASDKQLAANIEAASAEVDTNAGEENEEIKPIGKGVFGNIYDQFKGKVKAAFDFLIKHKSGDLLGVFHREGFGDIDLVWGDDKKGLQHIINDHILVKDPDFQNIEETVSRINDIIMSGVIVKEGEAKIVFEKDGYRVVISKNIHGEKKNWILTSYDSTNGKGKIKERLSDNTTTITPGANKGSRAVASSENLSTDKVTESSPPLQENGPKNSTQSAIESASAEVETSPTEAQKKAGNYKMGHVKVGAFDVTIENPKGSERSGTDANGKKWSVKMNNTYGYIRGTEGVDGDHIDVFLAEDMDKWDGKYVFVVDQYNPDGTFDEHKVMLGFNSMEEARSAYLSNYEKGWENGRRIVVTRIKTDDFQKWVDSSHRKTKPFAHYVIAGAADVAEGKPKNESDRAIPSSTSDKVRMQKAQGYSEFAEKHGVNADDVRAYAEGMALGNVIMANQAFTEIRRTKRIEHRGMKLSEFAKAFNPIKKELYEKFGNVDELNQEYVRRAEEERNMMEAARKKAEEEERKRQEHLDELSLLDDAAIDERYMEALQRGDEAAAREMLDEAARRKGYSDTASDYQGVGAWVASANPGYENDAERRADVEDNAPDVNIEDIALGYSLVDEKYWQEPRKYMQTDATAIESVNAIREAIAAVRRGEKNVKVKVYRAVPTSVKEGKLRNGDWVTPSKDYAKMHGEYRLEGKYRIIEDEVSVNELWWDGNDSREWGFDNGKGYKYKNVKNNRKSDDLVTRDDKGNVIPPSKRFNQRKADERYQKAGTPLTPNSAEGALRDAIADLMRKSGLDVIDHEEGQQVLDIANGRGTRLSAKQKRALETVTIADESTNNATAISSADGAKIQKNLESLAEGYSNHSNKSKGFITDLSQSLNLEQHEASHYGTFVTENGKTVTIRVSNHNARVSNFDRNGEIDGISIVISSHGNKGLNNDGNAHIVEFFYSKQSLERSEGKPLADIIRSVSTALKNGEFKDNTGLAQRQEVNEQTIREHRVYHGSGADFDHFDHSHMGEGEGAQVYGWGTYVTEVKGIGEGYAIRSMNGSSMSHEELSLKRNELEYYIDSAKEKLPFLKGEYKAELEAQISEWEEQLKEYEEHNFLYIVEIPDDNGKNYLDWDENTGADLINRIRETLRKNADLKELYDGAELNAELERLAPKTPFSETYIFLYELLGSDKAASQMLHDMGFTGIKYPADYRRGGRADGAKNYVIFNEEDAKITDRIRFFRTFNGEAYGFTVGGKIYIDPRIATAETPIHEYAHLWATAMREGNPTEWKNIVGLMKGTSVWAEVQKLYPELKSDDDIADEVLATFSGRRGAERLRAEQQKIMQSNGSVFEKAAAVGALARVKQALSKFWKGVADFLGIHYTSAEEVADRVMKDLLEGVDPRKFGVSGVLRESIRLPKTEYAKVAHAIATNKGLKNKGMNYVFTDNNYYIYTGKKNGDFSVHYGLPIEGNENVIEKLSKGIDNGTIRNSRGLHSVIEGERSRQNNDYYNNVDAKRRQESTGAIGDLALRQPTDSRGSFGDLGTELHKGASAEYTDRGAGREAGGVDDNLYRQGEDTPHTATSSESKSQAAQKATENLNLGGRVVVHESAERLEGKEATAKGWYDTKTGQIHVVLSNNADAADVTQTILHEAVAHHGLRELFGHNVMDAFLDSVLVTASQEVKDAIYELRRGKGWNFRTATEEYLAGLAERTDFERMTAEERGLFATIRRLFNHALEFLGLKSHELSDRELAYILWCSYQDLQSNAYFVKNHKCLYLLANAGRDTNASGSRYERIWEQIRTHMGRCSPKGIGFDVGSNIFRSIGPIRCNLKVGKKAINETEQKGECPFAP